MDHRVWGLCCLSVLALATATGQQPVEKKSPLPPETVLTGEKAEAAVKCELLEVIVRDPQAGKFAYVIKREGQVICVCLKMEGLKEYVASLPAGSSLSFTVSDARSGGELTHEQLQDLEKYCTAHSVELIVHPGG